MGCPAEKVTAMLTTQTDGERVNVMLHLAQTHLVKNSFFTSDLILSIYPRPLVLLASRQQKYRWDNKQYDCYIETLDSVNIAGKHSQKSPSSVSSVCVVWHRLTF